MCGIVGVFGHHPVSGIIYDSLSMLQHRGQDAAGIATCYQDRFYLHKENGLVTNVFNGTNMARLLGKMGIGHVRYPTAGCASVAEAQPFYVNSPYGIVFAHNGNLTNVQEIVEGVYQNDRRHLNTTSDSEVMLNVFAHALARRGVVTPKPADIFAAVEEVHERCKGGYAVVAMIAGVGMLAFRDPYGIRPLVLGSRMIEEKNREKKDFIIASESVALGVNDFHLDRDIEAGEAIFIDIKGKLFHKKSKMAQPVAPCLFEYVYLARPDSVIDGISVYQARTNMGIRLAEKIKREWKNVPIDVVIPIPETSRTAALEIAQRLNKPYREGFMKNRYIGRTFIMPGQAQRKQSIRRKLSPIPQEFKDRNVLLVDDSIVRGNTIKEIIATARDLGAKKVFVASTAPPVRYPNVYGIDMPARSELIASGRTVKELSEEIGADCVIFQDLKDLEASVFDGKYITGDITKKYLNTLQRARNDAAKQTEEVATHITRNLAAHL